jgi:hypothetical protein
MLVSIPDHSHRSVQDELRMFILKELDAALAYETNHMLGLHLHEY